MHKSLLSLKEASFFRALPAHNFPFASTARAAGENSVATPSETRFQLAFQKPSVSIAGPRTPPHCTALCHLCACWSAEQPAHAHRHRSTARTPAKLGAWRLVRPSNRAAAHQSPVSQWHRTTGAPVLASSHCLVVSFLADGFWRKTNTIFS